MTGFSNYEYIDGWEGPGEGGVQLGLRLPPPDALAAETAGTNPLAVKLRAAGAKAQALSDALVGHSWNWATVGEITPSSIVRFEPDGHVSGGWTWDLVEKVDGQFMVDCTWGANGHQYLTFDPALENFDAFNIEGKSVVKGQRVDAPSHAAAIASAPPATPSLPAIAEIRLDADPEKGLEASRGKPVRVGMAHVTQFKLVPGLKEPRLVSLEPVDSTGAYLRHKDAIIWLHQKPEKLDLIFEGNASFRMIHLDGDKYRFEASGLDLFITAKDDGSVVLARDPPPEWSTFVLKPVEMNVAAENGSPAQTQPIPPPVAVPQAAPAPATAATPAPAAEPAAAGKRLAEILVGYKWSWARGDDQGGTWRTILTFHPDGTLTNPTDRRTWYWWAIDDHTAHIQFHETAGSPPPLDLKGGMTLTFNADLTNYRGIYLPDPEKPVAVGERKEPTKAYLAKMAGATPAPAATPVPAVATPAPAAAAKSAPASPAARRAAQMYEAIVGYHWAWINIGDVKPPLVVDFIWDGHVSGGWTWEMLYKPDGETFVHCNWNGNGHQYLRLNEACDAFDAFDSDGQFHVKGKRLGPIGEPVNLKGLAAVPSADGSPAKSGPPSQQIEPLLEPSLNAILAPLEANPQMPRVAVEKLRASLAGASIKARTPLQKQIYQYGMAVCEALTNGMDERALTKATALSSAQVPWLSNGASIVNTMPLRGRDAGHAGDAIRGKQRDERNYADMKGAQVSSFMESSAYKAWIAKAAMLRQNVMGLYTRLVQLEAADTPATPQPTNP